MSRRGDDDEPTSRERIREVIEVVWRTVVLFLVTMILSLPVIGVFGIGYFYVVTTYIWPNYGTGMRLVTFFVAGALLLIVYIYIRRAYEYASARILGVAGDPSTGPQF